MTEAPDMPSPHSMPAARRRLSVRAAVEAVAVAISPLVAYFGLRLRLMPFPDLNDPAMHTTFMIDPRSIFLRYTAAFTPSARLREGYRVGLLIPGRISYLLFGGLPGFIVFRYVLVLVAVVPSYLLFRRLHGRWAGAVAAIVILSSPVVITAWGTDFPDSAAVSYLFAGLACLAMPSSRHRRMWLVGSAAFFMLAIWTIATAAPLVIVTIAVCGLIRLVRDRERVVSDAVYVAVSALSVTVLLAAGSWLLIGPFDYVVPTVQSLIYLGHSSLTAQYHSANWRWAPYVSYLLVPPAVVAVGIAAIGLRLRRVPTPHLIIASACTAQLITCVLLQFAGSVQILEVHYFSSLLWAAVSLLLTLAFVELSRPVLGGSRFEWLLPVLLLAVPLAYELDPHVPAFGWVPAGVIVVAVVLALAGIALLVRTIGPRLLARLASSVTLALIAGGLLILTVAPIPQHPKLPHTTDDTAPAYASALGGGDTLAVNLYVVTTELPGFVGPGTYSGEQLLQWWPRSQEAQLLEPIGIFHAFFDSIPDPLGELGPDGQAMIEQRRPAQILLLSTTGDGFPQSLADLAPYSPRLVRTGVLRSGGVALHAWLIDLDRYFRG